VEIFILRRIHRGTALLDKLEEREGSARITYSRDCGMGFVRALKFFLTERLEFLF
jgi:hypothetical protein